MTALYSLLSLLLLVILYFWLYRDYCTDKFRHELFCLRDGLFDIAGSGDLSFDDEAYRLLRDLMNGFIRLAHRINGPLFLLLWVRSADDQFIAENNPFQIRFTETLKQLTPEQQAVIERHYKSLHTCLMRHIVRSSPLFLLGLLAPLGVAAAIKGAVMTAVAIPFGKLDTRAMRVGELQNCEG